MVTDGTRMIYYHLHMCEIFYHARFNLTKIETGKWKKSHPSNNSEQRSVRPQFPRDSRPDRAPRSHKIRHLFFAGLQLL